MGQQNIRFLIFLSGFLLLSSGYKENLSGDKGGKSATGDVLLWGDFSKYIKDFNAKDEELYVQYIPNNTAEGFLKKNIPYFQCPDKELEKTYYFRWWTFRKHIKNTPEGFVITEFLPDVPWAGKYNTINCPAGHHFHEGRWLHDPVFLQDYAKFWFGENGRPRIYSFWAPYSILAFARVHHDQELLNSLLPQFVKNYESWENERRLDDGLFWQIDGLDGMEASIAGSGKRPTINSYMIGDAEAIAEIAKMNGNESLANEYTKKADTLRELVLSKLWDDKSNFFKTLFIDSVEFAQLKRNKYSHLSTFKNIADRSNTLADVRELHGYTPWYFNIPDDDHSVAWKFLLDQNGFKTPYGPTTAEQNHPEFKVVYNGHECQWNGPSWPMATSVTLKAMANLLRDYKQTIIAKEDFVNQLQIYSNSHRRINEKGDTVCWIDENINPFTGDWISRTILQARKQEPVERGKDYNHSAFCDFIISDLVGIRPSFSDSLTIQPLIPEGYWDWFCLDRVKYHNKMVTIVWDKDGTKYNRGKGFSIFIDNQLKHNSEKLEKIKVKIGISK